MNNLRAFNEMMRKVRTVKVQCTVTTAAGVTDSVTARVAVNRMGELGGNCLTGEAIYKLRKTGACTTFDIWGTRFDYKVLEGSELEVHKEAVRRMNKPDFEQQGAEDEK